MKEKRGKTKTKINQNIERQQQDRMKWKITAAQKNRLQTKHALFIYFPCLFHFWQTQKMLKKKTGAFLGWDASWCVQIHQHLSTPEILRWWIELMDWFKTQLSLVTDWIAEYSGANKFSSRGMHLYCPFASQWSPSITSADCHVRRYQS